MKTFFIRLSSGLVVAALAITAMLYNQYTFFVLMSIMLVGSLNEYFNVTQPRRETTTGFFQSKWFVILLCYSAFVKSFIFSSPPAQGIPDFGNYVKLLFDVLTRFRDSSLTLSTAIPILVFILFITELYSKSENSFENLGWKTVAIFWILVPMVLTTKIYFEQGSAFILAMFFIIWVYDSFCYIFGSLLGKRKLFERISPKKTWEGAIGGGVVTLVVFYFANKIPALQMLSSVEWVILAFVTIIAATYGDLVESMLKRNLGIKDSGNLMPGHGGFLDRLDSFYLVIPFVAMTLWMFAQVKNLLLVYEYLNG
ncbi:MAG: CDP-archaeol synthase [Bacteroidetes bacterium]|nr:CDP-archaeol synthase [Bacteroidota bacterium]